MTRGRELKVALLLAILCVARADRALFAHSPSTGALHAVALLRSTVATTAASTLAIECTFSTVGNYMITNGNGTWTYSYYSNNANLNGNDQGMGGDYSYPNVNIAWFNSNGAAGNMLPVGANFALETPAPSFDDPGFGGGSTGTVATALQIESPTALYTVGLTQLVFTSSKTGIAVGRYGGFADFDQIGNGVANTLADAAMIKYGQQKLNILLTYDGAQTWVRATGLPRVTGISAEAANLVTMYVAGSAGTVTPQSFNCPYPPQTVGDLTSVFMASKTLGWAVGGNDVTLAQAVSSSAELGPIAATGNVFQIPATFDIIPMGLVLVTRNGGSVWKFVPIWVSRSTLSTLWYNNDGSLKTIFNSLIPGILFAVQSDASGKHVYAVGSPSSQYSTSATAQVNVVNAVTAIAGVQVKPYGTILYSGSSGLSWVQQTAPTLFAGNAPYTLFDIAVQKGTTAFAVGGSPSVKFGPMSAGTIIYTTNGGFAWVQSVYPWSTEPKAPVFTCVSLQPSVAGLQTIWVGGFTTRTDAAMAALTPAAGAVDFYPVAAQTGTFPVNNPVTISTNQYKVKGNIYTILVSIDKGKTFVARPISGFPTGYVITSNAQTGATDSFVVDRSVYGITWDNSKHGWIYGYGYIIATHDGGLTWVYETPADITVTLVTPKVISIAAVPTTY